MKRKESLWVSVILLLLLSVVIPKAGRATADGMNIEKGYAIASDGTKIYFEVHGKGPFLFLGPPLTASPVPNQATPMADAYIEGLSAKYRVIVADYPRGYGKTPAPNPATVTGDSVTSDLLAIADAAGGGGYILSSSNSIHSSCKPENVVAMVRACKEFDAYEAVQGPLTGRSR